MNGIWFREFDLEEIRNLQSGTFAAYLGIEIVEIGKDFLAARMPLTQHLRQPFGLLHGGASAALAESLGSVAANFVVDRSSWRCVGQSITANHLRPVPVKGGYVTAVAAPQHIDARRHVWGIEMRRPDGKVFCVSTLAMAVIVQSG